MKTEFSWQIFDKYTNIKFHENPFSGSWVVPRRHVDRTKLTVTFRNFVNAPKIYYKKCLEHFKEMPENWIFKMGYQHTTNSKGRAVTWEDRELQS